MHGIKLNNPAYLKRIKFTRSVSESDLAPCDVCKGPPGAYHIARKNSNNETGTGYLYRLRAEGLAHAWCICNSELCFNMALISDLSEWHE